uniref:Isopenicillin N synthase-like Fe(2+) 2OG dioxygenase domain-containing protein n=1 Tax=Medicago truncatula TaxID=3880 RepID=B7FK81_MEDTR|nr:unknown [Medicago truncatula]
MITPLLTNGVPGLQICKEKLKQPQVWEDVSHVEGAIIVNIGDMMERWTNSFIPVNTSQGDANRKRTLLCGILHGSTLRLCCGML